MNERLLQIRSQIAAFWNRFSNKQKILISAAALFLIISTTLFIYFAAKPNYVPLFTGNLTENDVAQIKTELDAEGYKNYQITAGNVLVPEKDKYTKAADLAAKGVPKSDGVKLDIFSQNIGMGMTDRQFDVVERDAMQNQLADLLKTVDGVRNAKVILTMPQQSVFVHPNDTQDKASASIVVDVEPGKQLEAPQIRALYNLVSKSVPNLPTDNIVIMDQNSQMLPFQDDSKDGNYLTQYQQQSKIKKDVELDIQRNLQNMLGTILGQDKVYVYTYVKLNFDKTQREENLVEPVDKQNNEGIAISAQKIQESYTGTGSPPGGTAGSGQSQIPGYPGASGSTNNQYEKTQNSINYEVNRVKQNIVSQPYKIDDITINVGVEPPNPANPASLTPATQAEIQKLLGNVVRASLSSQGTQLTPQQINDRISVFPQTFSGKQTFTPPTNWTNIILYSVLGLVLVAAGVTIFIVVRRRRKQQETEELAPPQLPVDIPEIEYDEGEDVVVRKQLEKLAKQKPEEFVGLLRSWLADD
ncbi:flagellar basal-body MS-ring/collar protein FliF [Aneurinibacillus terranovensis]|uniref:flagellar basal-body MS-ring/collar protein FliF n=1 Tax=Aneurinibacillus terranovensis TaxID=278991 RepID=UPI000429F55B|nr:flagellar basal-body MS-ring/collar protein FliF [Aneurinibacillus terranovensis]